ncbi:MAG: phosphomannomutase/phosphoglucomutase, partial [Methanoculleus sp.]
MAGIFKAYDIRGRYPDELDEEVAKRIGNAFAHLLGAKWIVVGRDMRLSSAALAGAFAEGAALAGADVA